MTNARDRVSHQDGGSRKQQRVLSAWPRKRLKVKREVVVSLSCPAEFHRAGAKSPQGKQRSGQG